MIEQGVKLVRFFFIISFNEAGQIARERESNKSSQGRNAGGRWKVDVVGLIVREKRLWKGDDSQVYIHVRMRAWCVFT